MKRQHLIILAITVIAVFFGLYYAVSIYFQGNLPHVKDPSELTSAVHYYVLDLAKQKQPVPPTISLQELITKGYVKADDVRAFDGMDVTIYTTANPRDNQAVFLRAKLSDGSQMVILNDGSVQQVPR